MVFFREKNKNKNFENIYHSKLSSHNNYHIYYIYVVFQNSYSENSHYFQINLHARLHDTDTIESCYFHKNTTSHSPDCKETDILKLLLLASADP